MSSWSFHPLWWAKTGGLFHWQKRAVSQEPDGTENAPLPSPPEKSSLKDVVEKYERMGTDGIQTTIPMNIL